MRRLLLAACASFAFSGIAAAACPSDEAIEALSRSLLANTPAPALAGMTSLADGQCGQEKLVALMVRHWGRPVGYKVGLTNPAGQQVFGIPHPVTGTIYEATVRLRSGGEVPARFGAVSLVESDLMVRVRDEAINQARTHLEVLRNLDLVIPFMELPDLGFTARPDGPNLLASNVGARLGVLGEGIPVQVTEEFAARLGSMTVILASDQRELARAPGTALLGHPLNVIPWLAQDLASRGERLRAGELISLGGFSPLFPVEPGRTYTVTYEGLLAAPVTVSVRAN